MRIHRITKSNSANFKGRKKKREKLSRFPLRMRAALMHLIVYQGDTEFASTEQQRDLLQSAPSAYDRQCLLRVMREEQCRGCKCATPD
jgi:benzoyl-CoA 2,3-dioxygenase component B